MSVAKDLLFEEMSKVCPECGGENSESWGTCCKKPPYEDVNDYDYILGMREGKHDSTL